MLKGLESNLKINYNKDASGDYLEISGYDTGMLKKEKIEMLKGCYINLLPIHIGKKDGQLSFKYNITGKIKLSQYLNNRKIKIITFLNILHNITNILKKCKINKLDENSIIIDEEAIFIDPKTYKVYMAYLPITINNNVLSNLRSFLVNLVMFLVKFKESNSEDYVQKILQLVKCNEFNVFSLDSLVEELKEFNKNDKVNIEENTEMISDFSRKIVEVESKLINHHKDRMVINEDINIRKLLVNKILLQVIILIGFVLIIFTTKFFILDKFSMAIYLLFSGLSIYLSVCMWKDYIVKIKGRKIEVNIMNQTINETNKNFFNNNNANLPALSSAIQTDQTVISEETVFLQDWGGSKNNYSGKANRKHLKKFKKSNDDTNLYNASGKTISSDLLNAKSIEAPKNKNLTIVYVENGISKKIKADKKEFFLGRLKESVDFFVSNSAVGRRHAKIIKNNYDYFIVDLDSRNGTFLNRKRIRGNIEYLLKNNDELVFANYKVKVIIEYT
ncbi:MAG: DUF6382 domain-containing protein [Clostridiales bacterium]